MTRRRLEGERERERKMDDIRGLKECQHKHQKREA
jgi:hypothetical protein